MVLIDTQPFWRQELLTQAEQGLLYLLFKAHDASTYRPNVSSEMIVNACVGSGEYLKAIPAAMLTLGGLHGPILQAYALLDSEYAGSIAHSTLANGLKVPGWGSSFQKNGEKDSIWSEFEAALRLNTPIICARIDKVTEELHRAGKNIQPNPGCYTAACAIALRIPASVSPWLFLQGRLAAWSRIAQRHL